MSAQIAFLADQTLSTRPTQAVPTRHEPKLVTAITSSSTNHRSEQINTSAVWLPTTAYSKPSAFTVRKGIFLCAVLAAHAVIAIVLNQMHSSVKATNNEPLQVVMLTNNHSEELIAPTPPPMVKLPEMALPIEPVIDIAEAAPLAISVALMTTPTAATEVTGAQPKLVSAVEYVREPSVKYPAGARALKQHGTVMLRVLIDATGTPREVLVQQTSGHRLLDEAAISAVLKALYKPKTENGTPVAVYALIPIEFTAA